jgi:hypothetical protein
MVCKRHAGGIVCRKAYKVAWQLGVAGVVLVLLVLGGCGGGYSMNSSPSTPGSSQTSAVTLMIVDAPPARVTVLSFEVTVNDAVLNPGNVQLVTAPQKIEVKELETESAFLATANAPTGMYQSLTVNLTNPELTIMNQSGAAIGGCANNSVCHLEPAAAGNITFSSAPFPLLLAANTPAALQVDVHLDNLISNALTLDFNGTSAVTIAQLPLPGQPPDHLDDLDDLLGTVQNVDVTNKKFTVHTLAGDFPIQTDANTEFELEGCAANNFTCLVTGAVVEVDARVMAGGTFTAKKIELQDNEVEDELQGTIFKVDDATHFEMVVLGELRGVNNVSLGNTIVVTVNNANFQVDADGLTLASSLQGAFEAAGDTSQLLPGQEVQIKVGSIAAGPPIAVTTNRVRLRRDQFTANVTGAPAGANFNVGNLPGLFAGVGVSTIQVQTSSKANFQGIAGVSGLADQDQVSLRGLLFANGGNPPILIADKVRKR